MARGKITSQDATTLQMALIGYEIEKKRIEGKIREIETQLGHRKGTASSIPAARKESAPRKKRTLSAAARGRIAAAQKRRWAEHRKKSAQGARSSS